MWKGHYLLVVNYKIQHLDPCIQGLRQKLKPLFSQQKLAIIIAISIDEKFLIPYLFTYKAHHFSRENMLVR